MRIVRIITKILPKSVPRKQAEAGSPKRDNKIKATIGPPGDGREASGIACLKDVGEQDGRKRCWILSISYCSMKGDFISNYG